MSGGSFQNPSLHFFKRERLFPLLSQEACEIHHIAGGGAQGHTPIRLNDKIELVSCVKAEMVSDGLGMVVWPLLVSVTIITIPFF